MTKKLVWRLSKLPTVDELVKLIDCKLITQDEAKEILFKDEDIGEKNKELENEIKFLRNLVEKLSNDKSKIVETIKIIKEPYYYDRWYKQYDVWCGSIPMYSLDSTMNLVSTANGNINGITKALNTATSSDFSNIKTF